MTWSEKMTLWEVFLEGPGSHGGMLVLALPLTLLASLLLKLLGTVVLSRPVVKGLPSAPFKPPNGQGSEKFFDGRRSAEKWRRKYGSMYSIWSGFKREIVLTKPEHVKAFYKDSHMHIKATDNNAGWLFGELLGQCVGVVSQQEWRRVRKPFESHFSRSASMDRIGSLITEAAGFLNSFHVDNSNRDEHMVIHAADDLKYCPFFMVASIFFGELTAEMRTELAAIGPLREALFRDTFLGGISRYAIGKYLPGSAMPRLREFQQRWDGLVSRACREARAGIQKGAAILDLWKALEDGSLSMKELLQTLDESLFANLDVTANATAWTVIRIAQHPDVQEDLRRELHTYTQTKGSYEDYLCREETLLAACIVEVSRLHPILPFSNPESSPLEKTVGGYVIPKYTDVIVDAYAVNVDNPYWESPLKFDPSRHLGKKDNQARRYNMWRFGFGPRQCLGKNVADLILRVIVVELLQRYQLEMAENEGKEGAELQADSWIGLPDGRVKLTPLGQNGDACGSTLR